MEIINYRNSGVKFWDSGNPPVEEYARSCDHLQLIERLIFDQEQYLMGINPNLYLDCRDLLHPGYVALFNYVTQILLNHLCNYSAYRTVFNWLAGNKMLVLFIKSALTRWLYYVLNTHSLIQKNNFIYKWNKKKVVSYAQFIFCSSHIIDVDKEFSNAVFKSRFNLIHTPLRFNSSTKNVC